MEKLRAEIEPLLNSSIGLDRFEHPVVAADGQSYEKGEIEAWFMKSRTSPSTGLAISTIALYRHLALEQLIKWFDDDSETDFESALDRIAAILTDPTAGCLPFEPMIDSSGVSRDADSFTVTEKEPVYPNQQLRQLLEIYRSYRPLRLTPFDRGMLTTPPKHWSILHTQTEIPLAAWAADRPLLEAVFEYPVSRRMAKHLIVHGVGRWEQNSFSRQLIHYLARYSDLSDLAETLLQVEPKYVAQRDAAGKTPLMWAIESDNLPLVTVYATNSWSTGLPRYQDTLRQTPLIYAITLKRWSLVEKMLDNQKLFPWTDGLSNEGTVIYPASHLLAEIGPISLLTKMVRLDPTCLRFVDRSGRNLLYICFLFRSFTELLEVLNNDYSVVPSRCCIENGVAAECLNPFCSALEDNRQLTRDQKDQIRKKYATTSAPDRGQYLLPFSLSNLRSIEGSLDRSKFLGRMEIMSSRLYGCRDLLSTLLADPIWKTDPTGRTAMIAKIWEWILRHKKIGRDSGEPVVLDTDRFGDTLLHVALRNSETALLIEMFEESIELRCDRQENTPLHLACRFADEVVILTLIELSPLDHLTAKNRDSRTPLDFALRREMTSVVEAIVARQTRT